MGENFLNFEKALDKYIYIYIIKNVVSYYEIYNKLIFEGMILMEIDIGVYLDNKWIGTTGSNKSFNVKNTLEDIAKYHTSRNLKKLPNMKLDDKFESSVKIAFFGVDGYCVALSNANFTSKTTIEQVAKEAINGYNNVQCEIAKDEGKEPPKPRTVSQIRALYIMLQFSKSKE